MAIRCIGQPHPLHPQLRDGTSEHRVCSIHVWGRGDSWSKAAESADIEALGSSAEADGGSGCWGVMHRRSAAAAGAARAAEAVNSTSPQEVNGASEFRRRTLGQVAPEGVASSRVL